MAKLKVGLALGGGGARGLAHIGVLKVFQQQDIFIDMIAGTSMGAIVGAAYALTLDAAFVEKEALRLQKKIPRLEHFELKSIPKERRAAVQRLVTFIKEIYLLNLGVAKKWLINGDKIEKPLAEVFDEKSFADAKIPFAAVTTDLQTGQEIVLRQGKILQAILASISIPGIFPPIEKDGRLLVDGGVTSLVPVDAVRQLGADVVIAVNVERGIWHKSFTHGIDILFQADDIRGSELNRIKLASADVVITPEIQHLSWAHFSKVEECISRGEAATVKALPEIRKVIAAAKRRHLFRKLLLKG